ncbi:hypothetical protein FGRMN_9311 [Fusarium graminum]|nr:hypothetical protein FGRMN_9311 [Fusarium graminum]
MAPKAPSHGQKVDLGQNAPIKQEGAGKVASESLAAESLQEGGEFTSNEGIRGENQPSSGSENTSSGRTTNTSSSHESGSGLGSSRSENTSSAPRSNSKSESGSGSGSSHADTAPSYVNNQYIRAPGGPHGKNLHEGIDDSNTQDGLKKALASEPGSEDDPSRLAELQFQKNQSAAGRDAGPRQSELSSETAFDALDNEAST